MTQFTLMTYNVEFGFHSFDHDFEPHRLEAAQRAVKKVNPDLLALTEANYGGPNSQGIHMDYQKLFDFTYGHWGGYRVFGPRHEDHGGNCLLSQHLLDGEAIQFSHKGAVRGDVSIDGKIVTVDVVHPSHSIPDELKIDELKTLVYSKQSPYILTGDFNTLSPHDVVDFDSLREDFASFDQQKVETMLREWEDARCISWLLQQGLYDSMQPGDREPTVPTPYKHKTPQTGVRIDFAFHTPDLEVLDSYVLKNKDTDIASDHYPIVTVFELT